jgi:hypothetical protein
MHNFLALDMSLIPQSTKDYLPTFWGGRFSNDLSRMLIDGYNEKGDLVHPDITLKTWLQWSENPEEIIEQLLSTAISYTKDELLEETKDPNSIWYNAPRDDA